MMSDKENNDQTAWKTEINGFDVDLSFVPFEQRTSGFTSNTDIYVRLQQQIEEAMWKLDRESKAAQPWVTSTAHIRDALEAWRRSVELDKHLVPAEDEELDMKRPLVKMLSSK